MRQRTDPQRPTTNAQNPRIDTQNTDTERQRSTVEDALGDESLTVELFACASMYGTYVEANGIIDRVQSLLDDGRIDSFGRHVWTRKLSPAAEDSWCEFARERYREFSNWAGSTGRSLEPAFSTRTVENEYLQERHDVIHFPVVALAVYDGDSLVRVAPTVEAGGTAYTVEDCLTEIETQTSRPTKATVSPGPERHL